MLCIKVIQLAAIARVPQRVSIVIHDPCILDEKAESVYLGYFSTPTYVAAKGELTSMSSLLKTFSAHSRP